MAPKVASARGHLDYLRMRWNEGCRHAGKLFQEIQALGFKGSYQGVARFLSPWRESGQPRGRFGVQNALCSAQAASR